MPKYQNSLAPRFADYPILPTAALSCLLLLGACAHLGPLHEQPLNIDQVLEQISESLQAAAGSNPNPTPTVTSVQLDLQVGMATSSNLQLPINLVVLSGDAGEQSVHHLSLNFVPKPDAVKDPSHQLAKQFPGLTAAIQAIYQAGLNSNPDFLLKGGSVKVDCTFSADAGANVSILGLVPMQLGGTYSHQTVQTLTLNFGDPGSGGGNSSDGSSGSDNLINGLKTSKPSTTNSSSPGTAGPENGSSNGSGSKGK